MSSTDRESAIRKAKEAEIFSCLILAEETQKVVDRQLGDLKAAALGIYRSSPRELVLAASGASWSALYTGKYLFGKYSSLPVSLFNSVELVTSRPARLDRDCFGILASYSGTTEDTLDAMSFLREREVPCLTICRDADAPLSAGAKLTLSYGSKALYIVPVLQLHFLWAYLLQARGELADGGKLVDLLKSIPEKIARVVEPSRVYGEKLAEECRNDSSIFVLGGGPLFGLAYQTALTVFMEYLKIDGSIIDPGEFRHGPLEAVGKGHPTMAILMGEDDTRPYCEKVLRFCQKYGAKPIVFDTRPYGRFHALEAPFILFPSLQWFVLYMAVNNDIDLEGYRYMHKVEF